MMLAASVETLPHPDLWSGPESSFILTRTLREAWSGGYATPPAGPVRARSWAEMMNSFATPATHDVGGLMCFLMVLQSVVNTSSRPDVRTSRWYCLEIVYIEHDQTERVSIRDGTIGLLLKQAKEVAVVVNARGLSSRERNSTCSCSCACAESLRGVLGETGESSGRRSNALGR
jgi:hypothetical protein